MRYWVMCTALMACDGGQHDSDTAILDSGEPSGSEPSSWDASFEGLTAERMDGVLRAGLSHCSLLATYAFSYSDMDAALTEMSPPACPTTEVEGSMVRFTGGCTAAGSYTYEGVLEADNAGGMFGSYVDGQNTDLRFDDYSMTDSYDAWWFDGLWSLPSDATDAGTLETVSLSCDLGNGSFGTFGEQDCAAGEYGRECTYSEGTEGEAGGVGRFGLSGSFAVTEKGYDGTLTMEGQQTLIFQLAEAADGCTPYTLDGVPGEHCGI